MPHCNPIGRSLHNTFLAHPDTRSETQRYPRRESNPHQRFRKPLFYPLNYGDEARPRAIVAEGAGAAAIAAILQQKSKLHGLKIGAPLSGGNVDHEVFAEVLRA